MSENDPLHVPGSRWLRGYCEDCGTPMRVKDAKRKYWCEMCSYRVGTGGIQPKGKKAFRMRRTVDMREDA